MLPTAVLAALSLSACYADRVDHAFLHEEISRLEQLERDAPTRSDSLLSAFRLYSLTNDEIRLTTLPDDLEDGTGRELAILSAMWGSRARTEGGVRRITSGLRSVGLIERAKRLAPDDPLVTMIEAQSLLFRPRMVGGNAGRAARMLERLANRLRSAPACGVSGVEAQVWWWLSLRRRGADQAEAVRATILAAAPPPVIAGFLASPPGED